MQSLVKWMGKMEYALDEWFFLSMAIVCVAVCSWIYLFLNYFFSFSSSSAMDFSRERRDFRESLLGWKLS